jgi:hypothetical protein
MKGVWTAREGPALNQGGTTERASLRPWLVKAYGRKAFLFNRILKQAPSVVLGSSKSSTYPRGYASGFDFACGLAGSPV